MKEIQFKILIYPNITHKDIEKDSYINLLPNIISYLNKLKDDLHFTLLLPANVKSLEFHNTEQIIMDFPSPPNTMRTHFDSDKIKKILDYKNKDWDILYSHLPEHTLQLVNIFNNATHHSPKTYGYLHWIETNESMSNRKRNMFLQNISGILQMEECGVNSEWLKKYILNKSSEYFNAETLDKLSNIIQPHYLGIDKIVHSKNHLNGEPKKILFNHRHNSYTGYKWFLKCMDKLYKERKDFRVLTTHKDMDREYSERLTSDNYSDYMNKIEEMYIGVGAFKKYSAWSLSVTDGLSRSIPFLLPNDLVYGEMVGDDYPLLYENNEDSFLQLLQEVLDKPTLRNDAINNIKPKLEDFLWDKRISKWFDGWESIFNSKDYRSIKTSSGSYQKVIKYLSEKGYATKTELFKMLGWGVTFGFSSIRNSLRNDKRVMLTADGYKWISK